MSEAPLIPPQDDKQIIDISQPMDGPAYDPQILAKFSSIIAQPDSLKMMTTEVPATATKEKERIATRLSGFNPKDNNVWREITQRFGASIKHPELLSIATVLAQNANVKLDRDAKRRKSVLIKWFEENWAAISPFLDYVILEDSNPQK